ncbi:hypothetical protein ACWD4V_29430 [Streptomyces tsukubensis]|uniref:hypothetical protein n=1 Tax=Streptomyces tsukubensis TaxID=83656 RepID=UPI003692B683
MVKAQGRRTGRLLLFLALLFGVATMHTVGHPSSGHATGGAAVHAPSHADPAPAGDGTAAGAPVDVRGAAREHVPPPAASGSGGHVPPAASGTVLRSSGPSPGVMDPTLVCLAVLGAFGIALLLLAGAWLRRRAASAAPARTGTAAGARASPRPPPPRIRLAQLSVLRI